MDTHTDNNYEQIREIPRLDSALCNGSICSGIHCFKSWGTDQRAVDCGGVGLYLSDRLPFFMGCISPKNVLAVDPTRMTPAVRHNDGLDYVPTDKKVLFGHHFAAIAGAGPLVGAGTGGANGLPAGDDLAARWGWFSPVRCRISWCCLFLRAVTVARWVSWSKKRWGQPPGVIALVACFMIMVIILAVLAMIVVKALTHSPWGTYTVAFTIPLALFMGDLPALSASGAYWRSVGHRSGIPDFRHYLWRLGGRKSDTGTVL